jgi:S-adenosylmethionine-dependent methyltransferase
MQDRFADKSEWFDEHYATTRGRVRLTLVLERLRRRLPPPPARILDAGGGTGAFAVPLASDGYDVTLLDASKEWLDRARMNAEAAAVELRTVRGGVEEAANLLEPGFDAALCHAVLMYTEDPTVGLRQLRWLVRDDGQLSLLEKNQDAIALRPGLQGDYREARRLLHERQSKGRLGIENRAHTIEEWETMLDQTGWTLVDWVGARLFSDTAPKSLSDDEFDALLALERDAGTVGSYRRVSRLVHVWARARSSRPDSVAAPADAHR